MANPTCSVPDCTTPARTRGLCNKHYKRNQKYGDPNGYWGYTSTEDRFLSYVDKGEAHECWMWTGMSTSNGYGIFSAGGDIGRIMAHRYSYERYVGLIPDGYQIDHLCRTRRCVNPDHLEPVTQRENIRRGNSPSGKKARQTHCKRGHPFNEENTYWKKERWRECRTCMRAAQRRRYEQRRKNQ